MINKARIRQDGLAAQAYWPDVSLRGSALVLSGLPYVPDREPVTDCLTKHQLMVLQPQYAGTYDSDGSFAPESAVDSAMRAADILRSQSSLHDFRGDRDVDIPKPLLVLAAHSFGTFVAMEVVLRGVRPDLAVMLSPMFAFGTQREAAGIRVDMDRHVQHIKNALPLTFRLQAVDVWNRFFSSQSEFHTPPEYVRGDKRTKLLCVSGKEDPGLDPLTAERFVRSFCREYAHAIELDEFVVVKNGMHDSRTLMTEGVCKRIAKSIKK